MNRILAISVIAACGATACAQAPAGEITMETIRKKWQERQDKIRSLKCEIDAKEIIHKGSASSLMAVARPGVQGPNPDPATDVPVRGLKKVSIGHGGMRHECHVPIWSAVEHKLFEIVQTDTFDGKEHRGLHSRASFTQDYPSGQIAFRDRSQSATLLGLYPVVHYCRGCDGKAIPGIEQFEVGRSAVNVLGRPCIELVRESRRVKQRELLFVDRERDFVLVRRTLDISGRPALQLDVQYSQLPMYGWYPSKWEYILRAGTDNAPHHSGVAEVTS
jgi:hypothetical protein